MATEPISTTKIAEQAKEMSGKAFEGAKEMGENLKQQLANPSGIFSSPKGKVIIGCFLLVIIILLVTAIYRRWMAYIRNTPWLIKNAHDARNYLRINTSNPCISTEENPFILIPSSSNEDYGTEFTYSFWFFINDWNYLKGQWKHMFHRGNENSWPNRAPGVWLHPERNEMYIYMNSSDKIDENVVVTNLPMNKWVHAAIVVKNRYLDVYVNGHLKERKILKGHPKQNVGDIFVNRLGGFSGFLSKLRYYNYAISYLTLEEIVNDGPALQSCKSLSAEAPPYLSSNWWRTNSY